MSALDAEIKPALCTATPDLLTKFVESLRQPSFRSGQLADWIYRKFVLNPDKMSNLPSVLRTQLNESFTCCSSSVETTLTAADGTEKLLIRLADGEAVEMVLIPSLERMTFCLSTQIGCPVRCRFCASGLDGLVRNLKTNELLEQLYHGIARIGRLPDNLVFMGIGEGLLNFDNLAEALNVITAPEYIGMSPRRLTISTSGYVPGMRKLAELGKEFTLAVSLHAADDATREKLIPDGLRYPIAEILEACDYYQEKVGRMVTFEYTLIAGINDREDDAAKLARLAKKHHAKINLIPYNETAAGFKRPADEIIFRFRDVLESADAKVTLRMEKGSKVSAACGQLRAARKH
ncbi:MAG: 23S rRNA (adenine(2503)-C(2))-methyltransferase RlmN [Victivallaceae bacterium]